MPSILSAVKSPTPRQPACFPGGRFWVGGITAASTPKSGRASSDERLMSLLLSLGGSRLCFVVFAGASCWPPASHRRRLLTGEFDGGSLTLFPDKRPAAAPDNPAEARTPRFPDKRPAATPGNPAEACPTLTG